jgi:branched-chain amino acid transport system permease protein
MSSAVILQAVNGISLAGAAVPARERVHLTFGLMRVVNMAYGAYYLLGGYVGYSIARPHRQLRAWRCSGGGLTIVVIGFFVDRFLIRPLGANHLAQVLLTVGVAFVIGEVCLAIWGGDNLKCLTPVYLRGAMELPGGLYYPKVSLRADPVRHVRGGRALADVSQDADRRGGARRCRRPRDGQRHRHQCRPPVRLVSALASFLAGMAGVVGGCLPHAQSRRRMGHSRARAGRRHHRRLGSLEGAILGSIIVGLLDAYGRWLLPEFSYFVLFGPMAILLLFRATGIFGKEH